MLSILTHGTPYSFSAHVADAELAFSALPSVVEPVTTPLELSGDNLIVAAATRLRLHGTIELSVVEAPKECQYNVGLRIIELSSVAEDGSEVVLGSEISDLNGLVRKSSLFSRLTGRIDVLYAASKVTIPAFGSLTINSKGAVVVRIALFNQHGLVAAVTFEIAPSYFGDSNDQGPGSSGKKSTETARAEPPRLCTCRRLVRWVRKTNTTEVEVDVDNDTLDWSKATMTCDEFDYWDVEWEEVTYECNASPAYVLNSDKRKGNFVRHARRVVEEFNKTYSYTPYHLTPAGPQGAFPAGSFGVTSITAVAGTRVETPLSVDESDYPWRKNPCGARFDPFAYSRKGNIPSDPLP